MICELCGETVSQQSINRLSGFDVCDQCRHGDLGERFRELDWELVSREWMTQRQGETVYFAEVRCRPPWELPFEARITAKGWLDRTERSLWGATAIDPLFEKTVLVETYTPEEMPDLLAEEGLRDIWMEIVSGGGKVHLGSEEVVLVVASEQGAVLQEAQLQALLLVHWVERVLGWDDEDDEVDDEEADGDGVEHADPAEHPARAARPSVCPDSNASTAAPQPIEVNESSQTAPPTVATVGIVSGAGLLAATLAGALYSLFSFIIPLVYLTFLLTILLGATVGCTVSAAAGRCRIPPGATTGIVAGLAGVVAVYAAWLVWLGLLFEFDFVLWFPFDIVRIAAELSREGVWSIFGWTPVVGFLGAFWVFEMLLVVAVAAFTGYQGTRFGAAAGALFSQS